jgi:hypothetical protein
MSNVFSVCESQFPRHAHAHENFLPFPKPAWRNISSAREQLFNRGASKMSNEVIFTKLRITAQC